MGLVKRVNEIDGTLFGDIGLLKCDPVKIQLKENAVPYSINTARRVPFPILSKVKEELEYMVSVGVIEPVTEPTDWCAPMVPVVKRNGNIRICVDLKKLNESVRRERFILPTFDDIIPKLVGARVFSKLDASSGFYQMPLDPESSRYTTFITPFWAVLFPPRPIRDYISTSGVPT
ncbi:PREDICTED: uncharacterized protein K02A2.6-like [Priapulus caudatus]|uniref:Uncharacterized protein K02A2.6-like n=1 Tax=Priapulus caudatus TaxID=37621 RepID=A0ABM1F645_PRICU|nr:PREDICTED: uncharacterized protein K02A2.6-like [Priapulus caudatus]